MAHFFFLHRAKDVSVRAPGKQELIALLEPTVQSLGYELVDIDVRLGSNGLLRLYIDREPPVTLADCELISEQIGAFLDVEDPLPGSYVLEVSSPGADRRLRTAEHFARFTGRRVRIELRSAREGRRRFTGELTGIDGDRIGLEVDGQRFTFGMDEIAVARLVADA